MHSSALVVAAWPVGLALIFGIAFLLVRRIDESPLPAATEPAGDHQAHAQPWTADAMRMVTVFAIGSLIVFGLMVLLGELVTHEGPRIDGSIYDWTSGHRVHAWFHVMARLTKIGNTWTAIGAVGAAAVCLAVTWPAGRRWIPPVALAGAVLADHFLTRGLWHVFNRAGPPDAPHGTYPSGGCERAVLFYGLIAYLLWREFSGRRSTAIWAGAAVAALAYNEAYSRGYLTVHWFTDILAGLIYGCLMLAVCIAAVRSVTGPAVVRSAGVPEVTPGSALMVPTLGEQTP
jgi:membrane-associated phospholipid phosphatase